MTYLIDDAWKIVKDFMLDWKTMWNKKMTNILKDIHKRLPKRLIAERYDMKTNLYHTTFRFTIRTSTSHMGSIRNVFEKRVCNLYDRKENEWFFAREDVGSDLFCIGRVCFFPHTIVVRITEYVGTLRHCFFYINTFITSHWEIII